jgi:protein involved in polysaccharide export with SLBB domain
MYVLPPISKIIGALAVAGKSFQEIQEIIKKIYGNKALKTMQLFEITKDEVGETGC